MIMKESSPIKRISQTVRLEIAKRGAKLYSFEDNENHIDKFAEMISDKFPVVYFNHQSHIDIGPMMEAADRLNARLEKPLHYNLPVAISIKKEQGEMIGNYYAAFSPLVEKHNIKILEVARKKDRALYGLEETEETIDELDKTVFTDKGVVMFPEGTTTSGKLNKKTGERNGIVEIRNRQLSSMTRTSTREADKQVAYLPIALNGGYRIFDTSRNKIPLNAYMNMALNEIPFVHRILATARVGSPFTSTYMIESGVDIDNDGEVNTYLMKKIASMLPFEMRGYYK